MQAPVPTSGWLPPPVSIEQLAPAFLAVVLVLEIVLLVLPDEWREKLAELLFGRRNS